MKQSVNKFTSELFDHFTTCDSRTHFDYKATSFRTIKEHGNIVFSEHLSFIRILSCVAFSSVYTIANEASGIR